MQSKEKKWVMLGNELAIGGILCMIRGRHAARLVLPEAEGQPAADLSEIGVSWAGDDGSTASRFAEKQDAFSRLL